MMLMRMRRQRSGEPSDATLLPLGHARFAHLAWSRPTRWEDRWQLVSERGVHAERWPTSVWKGELGVRFADSPPFCIRSSWNGVPRLEVAGEEAPRLTHHAGWLGAAEWRRRGQPSLHWKREGLSANVLTAADGQPLLRCHQESAGFLMWSYVIQLEDQARALVDLPELLALTAYVAMGGGHRAQ